MKFGGPSPSSFTCVRSKRDSGKYGLITGARASPSPLFYNPLCAIPNLTFICSFYIFDDQCFVTSSLRHPRTCTDTVSSELVNSLTPHGATHREHYLNVNISLCLMQIPRHGPVQSVGQLPAWRHRQRFVFSREQLTASTMQHQLTVIVLDCVGNAIKAAASVWFIGQNPLYGPLHFTLPRPRKARRGVRLS